MNYFNQIEDQQVKFALFLILFFFILSFLLGLGSDTKHINSDPYHIPSKKSREYKNYY